MYNVLNNNALTLVISRTPKRLKTSCESTSEETGLARRKTKSKYHFSFQTLKDRLFFLAQRYELNAKSIFVLELFFPNEANWKFIS